jgi:hypothetical protein
MCLLQHIRRTIEGNRKDYDLKANQVLESKHKQILELQVQMAAEVHKRDEQVSTLKKLFYVSQ